MTETSIFAIRLREARKARGVSQKQLGILAGVDEFVASARLNQYERGKHTPDLNIAERLARELGVPMSYLFEPEEDLATLILLLGRLSGKQRQNLIKQLRGETPEAG